ncbi:MAG: LysM peptidoglycan-binding domain-containing protein [Planctomycetaceae bacterium]|nr:LysM peptidoglycan-binding domain-containing protein [Planctomycetaceae bacterium]
MSKRNHFNRPAQKPYFAEVRQAESDSDAPNELAPFLPPIVVKDAEQDVVDEDEDDDCEKVSYLNKAGSFLYGCCEKTTALSKSATACTWNALCKIPSYCVLRWESEESTESDDTPKAAVTVENDAADADEYDEDESEHTPSRWWGVGIKTAALAASVLVLAGGYIAFKPMLDTLLEQPQGTELASKEPDTGFDAVPEMEHADFNKEPGTEPFAVQAPDNDAFAGNPGTAMHSVPGSLATSPVPDSLAASPVPDASELLNSFGFAEERSHKEPEMVPLAVQAPDNDAFAGNPGTALHSVPGSLVESPLPGSLAASPIPEFLGEMPAPSEPPANLLASLAALQPLAPVESPMPDIAGPQLQPLTAMATPELVHALPSAPIASDFAVSPTPPVIQTIQPTAVQPTIPIVENVREIVPMIPASGLIEEVPPPPPPVLAEAVPVHPVYPNEFAPAIPTDASAATALAALELQHATPTEPQIAEPAPQFSQTGPQSLDLGFAPTIPQSNDSGSADFLTAEFSPIPIMIHPNETAPLIPQDVPQPETPVVAAVPLAVAESTPRILPAGSQPMDWQLWEQIRELRDESESAAANLRFEGAAPTALTAAPATAEPALRFEPRNLSASNATLSNASPTNEVGQLLNDAMQEFNGLMPTSVAMSDAADIAGILSDSGRVPPPVFADPRPAYRNEASNQLASAEAIERSVTFQSQIDAEISRSPDQTQHYVIQQGDTYMTISDRFYGTSLLYTALAAHNQRQGIGWRPAEGVSIEVPPAEYLREQYGEVAQRQIRQMNTQQASVRYVVQEGDTIFRLATDKLRDSSRWREIYALNADRLQDIRSLTPGMEILLPAETARR